jgi:hypothetical protein
MRKEAILIENLLLDTKNGDEMGEQSSVIAFN